MNEIFQIVAEKETITKELTSEETNKRFKELEKIVLRFFTIFLNLKNLIYIGRIEAPLLRHRLRKYLN